MERVLLNKCVEWKERPQWFDYSDDLIGALQLYTFCLSFVRANSHYMDKRKNKKNCFSSLRRQVVRGVFFLKI